MAIDELLLHILLYNARAFLLLLSQRIRTFTTRTQTAQRKNDDYDGILCCKPHSKTCWTGFGLRSSVTGWQERGSAHTLFFADVCMWKRTELYVFVVLFKYELWLWSHFVDTSALLRQLCWYSKRVREANSIEVQLKLKKKTVIDRFRIIERKHAYKSWIVCYKNISDKIICVLIIRFTQLF